MVYYKMLLKELYFYGNSYRSKSPDFIKIGEGRSASVFKVPHEDKVIKVFYPGNEPLAESEIESYKLLSGVEPYYLNMYDYGENFLVLDYILGKTLYQYLIEGIFIEEWILKQVDEALSQARLNGLNPSDIHLKNIILVEEKVKMIDLARFKQDGICRRWDDLKKAYYSFYLTPLFPKKIPEAILEHVALLYKKNKISI